MKGGGSKERKTKNQEKEENIGNLNSSVRGEMKKGENIGNVYELFVADVRKS